ncbi:UBX domain-containing protein [Ditylenchus destructor]|uniref:UBX domain-containing protein 4 n=1 Tax=Ditylenchus destructor TaxID=166010 RepID=A0AAD4R5N7_9BILA|nr:UBX domain-containing protein [Ditylenchus destructor]
MIAWFEGTVNEAIEKYQKDKSLLIVYIHHEGTGDENTNNFNQLWETLTDDVFTGTPFTAVRMTKDTEGAKNFAEFFPTPIFPVCYILGLNGQPLEVVTAVEKLTVDRLRDSLRKAINLFRDQIKEQGLPIPQPSQQIGTPTSEAEVSGTSTTNEGAAEDPAQQGMSMEEKIQYAREIVEKKRKLDEEKKKEEEREKEKRRREEGKLLADLKEKNRDRELREAAEARRKEKEEDAATLRKLREQIRLDNEERKKRAAGGVSKEEEVKPREVEEPVTFNKPVAADECKIQCKFPNGSTMVKTFPSGSPLQVIIDAVKEDGRQPEPFFLLQVYPRRQLNETDKSLLELNLTPSSALLVVSNAEYKGNVALTHSGGYLEYFQLLLGFLYTPVAAVLRFVTNILNFRTPTPAAPPDSSYTAQSTENTQKRPAPKERGVRREGNIGRLGNDDSSDENEAFYNGNSTQQL